MSHEFCRYCLRQVRKENPNFKERVSGLGNYYTIGKKTYEIHSCCRWSGKAKAIQRYIEEKR